MTTTGSLDLDKAQWKALLDPSNGPAARRLTIQLGLIVLLGALIWTKIPLWPILLLPQGCLLIFLFAPLHECIHRTAFRTRWCNDLVAFLCGWLVLLPPTWFRHFHMRHHRFTNNPDRDPELAVAKPGNIVAYVLYMSGLAIWASQIQVLLGNSHGRDPAGIIPNKARNRVALEARWYLAIYVLAFAALGEPLLWVWIVPVLIGQPFLRAFLLAEHIGCALVRDMTANSRTTFTNRAVRWLTWNMSYHAEHHLQPAVPYHKLPDLHSHTRPHLKVTQSGYLNLHRALLTNFV